MAFETMEEFIQNNKTHNMQSISKTPKTMIIQNESSIDMVFFMEPTGDVCYMNKGAIDILVVFDNNIQIDFLDEKQITVYAWIADVFKKDGSWAG